MYWHPEKSLNCGLGHRLEDGMLGLPEGTESVGYSRKAEARVLECEEAGEGLKVRD